MQVLVTYVSRLMCEVTGLTPSVSPVASLRVLTPRTLFMGLRLGCRNDWSSVKHENQSENITKLEPARKTRLSVFAVIVYSNILRVLMSFITEALR